MRLSLGLAVLLVAGALAGCISDTPDTVTNPDLEIPVATFPDPRTTPHPEFGWPTMSHPYTAEGVLVNDWLRPIAPAELPEVLSKVDHLATAPNATQGAGIAVFGHIAILPGHGGPSHIYDISDPAGPVSLAMLDEGGNATLRDVDVIIHPDGRITAVFATNQGVVPVFDITDPRAPVHLVDIEPTAGSHNVAIVPGTPILYNANSAGGGGTVATLGIPEGRFADQGQGITEIYDLSDPAAPELLHDWKNGFGCHDITFWLSAEEDRYRAYCAGIQMTQIWDIADPTAPSVVVNVPVHHGDPDLPSGEVFLVNFAHLAMVSPDGQVLIVGDETGGGLAMGCDAYVDAQAQTASGPFGNLWFYDLSDETDPRLKSWFSPDPSYIQNPPSTDPAHYPVDPSDPIGTAFDVAGANPGCTAHFGRAIDDTRLLTMAFYGAGVLLIDYEDIAHPVIVDQWVEPGMNAWDVWYYQGYLFTGDLARGLDVLTLA